MPVLRPCGILFVSLLALVPGGCRPVARLRITLAGSTSVQPFAERLAEVYTRSHPEVDINVQGGGSSAGIRAVQDGICQIGMSSRALTPDEAGLTAIPIALDGIVLTTACANPVSFLTSPQACAVFAGEVRDWQQLGGPSRRITVITREEGSGTRASFEEKVMTAGMPPDVNGRTRPAAFARDALVQDSNGAVREIVASDPAAIGYISFGLLDDRVRALALDGVAPSEEAIQQGRYPVVRRFLFLTNSHRPPASARQKQAVASFLDFALSPAGQQVLVEEGLVSILP